jgi:site-specific DNA-cytosine methylase
LDENLSKEKLSITSTLIKEIIQSEIFTCAKTEKPITTAIILSRRLPLNYLKGDLLNLRMGTTISISDSQRYKVLGNAVTVNVIETIMKRIMETTDTSQ